MKSSLIRPALALAVATALTACGGGSKEEYAVKGTVTGIAYEGAVITTNGQDLALAVPSTPGGTVNFEFPKKLEYGDEYNVVFKSKPANQDCYPNPNLIQNNNDTAGRLADINITLVCVTNTYSVGGKVIGLAADGLVVANGSNTGLVPLAKAANNATFNYTVPNVAFGVTYSVAVVQQPSGQTCTVANGTGTMAAANVTNVDITCVNNPT